ncbi:hypothetical protein G7Y89_g3738 [Cudoniella acicularis]|uniref:Mannosyltransferase n=1 Tax=Cudoniella acicularis TaxID=354080 RepID=A0A8H4RTS5_9HELO|nr:hypothetical protein G7Y89_g3738 [Cudoniella acicularis]
MINKLIPIRDAILNVLLPTFILLHLIVAPYTKVEESFNIQATHDIAIYGFPTKDVYDRFQAYYDHFTFPGAVPRTFVGALALAGLSRPIFSVVGFQYAQYVVRGILGLFNAFCLLRFKSGLQKAFGNDIARWYLLLQLTQFHVIYYASRTLPNMFAFGLTTLAFYHFLPLPDSKQIRGIFFLVFAGIVFRSEIAVLLFTQLVCMLAQSRISIQQTVAIGIMSSVIALSATIQVDSYFWQKPLWPELWGFYYNAIQGKSAEWGTSPFYFYFTSQLPKLLLNPFALVLIPMALALPATKYNAFNLLVPSLSFIAIYSVQPHKEGRFIIYVVPPLTAAAALSASYIWTRRAKSLIYRLGSLLLIASVLGSFLASTAMLLISSLNYPGGDALSSLHAIIKRTPWPECNEDSERVSIHMDILSCMTGVTRFQEIPWRSLGRDDLPVINGRPTILHYDKTEDEETLLRPNTIYSYAGIEFLRPGDGSSFSENMERVYAANNITVEHDGKESPPDSADVEKAVESNKDLETGKKDPRHEQNIADLKARLLMEEMSRFGTFNLLRDAVRMFTGGWWVGPRMRPAIRILKRVKDPLPV